MCDVHSFDPVVIIMAAIPTAIGVVAALMTRRRWCADPARRARLLPGLVAVIDLAVVLSLIPELATYTVYHGGLMHAPAMARFFALFAAAFSMGFVLPLAVPLLRRNIGPRHARLRGVVAIGLALLPWPLHGLTLALIESIFGIHFFWR